jgi:hypothetical protein
VLGGADESTSHFGDIVRKMGRRKSRGRNNRNSSDRHRGSKGYRGLLEFAKYSFSDELFLSAHKSEMSNSSDTEGSKSSELGGASEESR